MSGYGSTPPYLVIQHRYSQQDLRDRHGVVLSDADALSQTKIDAVIVMSRMFADEIAADVKKRAPQAQIILYADLLAQARLAKAA